ncbi:MAG: hypothetical protein AB8G11_08375 [Saprospiraceae bacterium]
MKYLQLLCLSGFLILNSCTPMSKLAKAGITFNEGDDFIYEVIDDGEKYKFNINLNGIEAYYISFDWEIPEKDLSGAIFMDETAINSAKSLHNYMKEGYLKLTDKTSVWVSKMVYNEIKGGEIVELLLDGNKENFKLYDETFYEFGKKMGKPYRIPVIVIANEDASKKIWIADDKDNCLIVMMELDFNIRLIDFKVFE